jgi:hypothetical protein
MTLLQKIVGIVLVVLGFFICATYPERRMSLDLDPGSLIGLYARVSLLMLGSWILILAALRSVSSSSQHEMIFAGSACILAVATMQYSSWGAPLGLALIVGASIFSRAKQLPGK